MRAAFAVGLIVASLLLPALASAQGEFKKVPPWWVHKALCVHRGEGSWTDPNPPYFGGMQMSLAFQRAHGGWMLKHYGTADNWTPRAQLVIAYRGWKRQGWDAWPAASRMCGLR